MSAYFGVTDTYTESVLFAYLTQNHTNTVGASIAAKSDFDHRNPHFAVTPTVGVKMNSDHQNSFSRQTPAAGVTTGIHFHGKRPPQARQHPPLGANDVG